MGGNGVFADANDDGVFGHEVLKQGRIAAGLGAAAATVVFGIEIKDDPFAFVEEFLQRMGDAILIGKGEARSKGIDI